MMTPVRLCVRLAVALAATAVVVGVSGFGLLPGPAGVIVDNAAQLAAGLVGTLSCWWTARRSAGAERLWRALMAMGIGGWTVGQALWSWYQIVEGRSLPSPSWADVGYLTLPPFALAALLVIASQTRRPATAPPRRVGLMLVLDGLIVVGSLLILTWSTALGAVVHAGAPGPTAFVVAIAYPITDLMLVVIVILVAATGRGRSPRGPQLLLLGLGLVGLSASDSIFAYVVSSGADEMPPLLNAGFVAGPVLIALAALVPVGPAGVEAGAPAHRTIAWGHLLLPYLPVAATGTLILVQTVTGAHMDPLEIFTGWLVVGLVVVRQMITLVDNTVLLEQVSDGRQRLEHQAYHDPLTGLANRTLFRARLVLAVDRHRREGHPVALLFVDLDDFKLINDSLGHVAGDRLLTAVSDRLRDCVRGTDVVGRLGGDEFGVLLEGIGSSGEGLDEPEQVGRRVLATLREPFSVDGRIVSIGASVGIAVPGGDEPTLTADAMLRRADAAMYAGKRRGKGVLVRYRSGLADGMGHPDLLTLLAAALAGDSGFEVHYQPIVRIRDGAVVALEALARWFDPVAGPVAPEVFVPLAERAGLVAALDDLVLNRACRDAAAVRGATVRVHVNVSARRLGRPELETAVARALSRHALEPDRLVLEITETSQMGDLRAAAAGARRLHDLGVRLALDDFGTGFNALAQLHALPVDVVKLDAALTAIDGEPDRSAAVCRSVLAICAEMGVEVVAEGVETASQAAALARLGCGLGQGYLYGPPIPEFLSGGSDPTPSRSIRIHAG